MIAGSVSDLQRIMNRLTMVSVNYNMKINTKKTNILRVSKGSESAMKIVFAGEIIEQVKEFCYYLFRHKSLIVSNTVRIFLLWVRDCQCTIHKTHIIIFFYISRTLLVIQPLWRFEVRRPADIVVSGKI